MKRIIAILLIFAMLCGMPGCGEKTGTDTVDHTELPFDALALSGIDAKLEIARAKELLFRIEHGELTGTRAQDALDARTEAYRKLRTDASLVYVRYCKDVTNEANKQAYDALSVDIETLSCILIDAALLLKDDPALSDRYDAETVNTLFRDDALSDPSILPLAERELALIGAYEALPEKLRVEYKGKTWTGDEILSDATLSFEDFDRLYESYMELFNAEAGAIFSELIKVRNAIAETLGYDSYAAYRYACIGRSYTPEDARRLSEQVQKELAPIISELQPDFFSAAGRLYGMTLEQEPTLQKIGVSVANTVPELKEAWDYMLSHQMYDLGTDPNRMPLSFTTYFAEYGAPFLFSSWTGGFDMIPTVVHEFGHFAAYYLNGNALSEENALDLAEIDSQGLELLTALRYDTLYGDDAEAAETAELFYALYALVDGCAEDAFQQFAYAQEEPTAESLNAEYERICTEYGLDALGLDRRSWTQIPHTFQSPFYYISYTTSMIASLELYLIGKKDPDAAIKAYRSILMRHEKAGLTEVLTSAGLSDPLASGTIEKLACALRTLPGFITDD